MKAEQRHQLQTNYLADQMGKLWQGSKTSSSGMIWGVLLLVVALGLAYWWWTGNAASRVSTTWVNWWDGRSSPLAVEFMEDKTLREMADHYRGSAADNAARLTLADQLYEKGYQTTFKESAPVAAKHFAEAFNVYQNLSATASARDVVLRSMIGAARSQESIGDIEQAKTWYQKVVTRFGEELKGPGGVVHPIVAEAQARIASFEKGNAKAFYADANGRKPWPARVENTKKTTVGPFGEMPPLPDSFTPPSDIPPGPPTFPETGPSPIERPAPPAETPPPPAPPKP